MMVGMTKRCAWKGCTNEADGGGQGRSTTLCRVHRGLNVSYSWYRRSGGALDRDAFEVEARAGRLRKLDPNGYEMVYVFDQPWDQGGVTIRSGWRHVHRMEMERILGRPMVKGESVHHKDGNRANNDPSNLELWVGGIRFGQRAHEVVCPHCGESYLPKRKRRRKPVEPCAGGGNGERDPCLLRGP